MVYVLDPNKGVCFIENERAEKRVAYSDGLDQFDWTLVLPQLDTPIAPAEDASEQPKRKGKDLRKEKRESKKKSKKFQNAAIIHSKLSHSNTSSPPLGETEEFNPYLAQKKIKGIFSQIAMVAKGEEDIKLFKFASLHIYKSDAHFLLPGEWLNDNNISFMYEMISAYFLKDRAFGFHISLLFPALIQLFLHYPVEEDLQGILPVKDLLKSKLVFIPFNFMDSCDYVDMEDANNGDHWALCVLSIPEKRLYVYDSMVFESEVDENLLHKFTSRLQNVLFGSKANITVMKMKCDQQENFDDCGVFLIMFSCYLLARLLSGEPTDLNITHVKFNPLKARLRMLEIVYSLSLESQPQLEE